ncbi:MAG: ABC transporter substrate-binding protein [Acidaminococcales bacterium]|jgi:ABC-type nitrate/sulfonate/bicarbonate transport system substrate-binding protein|nr:ABC transporter substrate-binding protein [Acidaminococcales bacterium]
MKKNTRFWFALFFVLILCAGCSTGKQAGKEAADAGGRKLSVVRVPKKSGSLTPDIFEVGNSQGFFVKHGIKLEIVGSVPSSQAIAAVVADKVDVTHPSHINRTIAGISAGAKVKAVVGGQETSKRVPHMVGVIRKDSPIKGAKDLLGKKIGITQTGGCHEYTPYAYLQKNGVENPKSKVEIIILPEKQLQQALRQNDLDLIMLHKIPAEIDKDGEFKVLFSDYDIWGTIGGATPLFFSDKFIKSNPETVRNFVAATAETLNWANANPEKAMEISAKAAGGGLKGQDMTEGYYAPDGIIKEETITVWIDLLREFDEIKGDVKASDIYTNEFNPYYKK